MNQRFGKAGVYYALPALGYFGDVDPEALPQAIAFRAFSVKPLVITLQ
jgi:hypothetical protein